MRVLYFAHSVLSRGGDRMVLAHLNRLAAAGHTVTIRANVFETVFAVHPSIDVKKIGFPFPLGSLVAAIVAKFSTDCAIATIIPMACLLSARNREKVVYLAQEFEELGYHGIGRLVIRFFLQFGLGVLRLPTIAVSDNLSSFLREKYKAQVETVTNGIDTGAFFPDPRNAYISLKGAGRAVLLYARKDPRKGFDVAVDVVKKLKREAKIAFDVWIFGEDCSNEITAFPFRHFGFLNDAELRGVFSSADVFLYPSRTDAYGLVVAEAFACKCPVVTTSAVPVAKDEENALVSSSGRVEDLAEKVSRLLSDNRLSSRLADSGYRWAQGISVHQSTRNFEKTLFRLRNAI